nr:MG2 domain-containing protein [Methylotetracoccus sp.]
DDYPPLAKFSGEFGILEAKEGGILPVTLRNLENQVAALRLGPTTPATLPGQVQRFEQHDGEIIHWIKKVKSAAERRGEWIDEPDGERRWQELTGSSSVFEGQPKPAEFAVPKPLGDKAFEVIGISLQQPGFYVVELASPKLGAALLGDVKTRYVATSALVTNLAVHFKWGREGSLVWVTTLDAAKPVPNAALRISQFCSGALLWEGRTGADGMATVESGRLPEPNSERDCTDWNESSPPLFVSARSDGDLGFTLSGWNQGIQPSSFGLTTGSAYQSRVAHAVFDRTLLRAGETVSMKLFLRERVTAGFVVPRGDAPDRLQLRHAGSGQTFTQPVSFDGQGIAESSWAIPRDAKLGSYQVQLYRGDQWMFDAGQFQVQQFRIPTMTALIQPAAGPWVNPKEAAVDLFVGYLSGGGAKGLPVKFRTQIRPRTVSYPDYADYSFGGEEVAEGIQDDAEEDYEDESVPSAAPKPARVLALTLDQAGAARATIPDLPALHGTQDLVTELEYQDANGERLTVAQNIPRWPAKLNLGLRTEGWVASKNRLRFQVLALDLSGKPLTGQTVRAELLHKTTFSYRKRLIGGFYAYENKAEVKRLDAACEAATDRAGVLSCDLKPGVSGHVILRATAKDGDGNTALATRDVWIEAGGDWWFDNGPADRMDVLPEQRSYERGETARFQVRSPFREATALVTVEREGVIDAFVTPLSGKSPVVEVPIKDHYAPNVYVSVLAVRGRPTESFGWLKALGRTLNIGTPDESVTALVDLSKPAYRLGVARIDVGWAPNRLDVRVTPDRETFKVREQAKVKVAVTRADGGPLPAEAELAFAAVDEGLLEQRPNTSWRLLDEMMGQRGIEVYTATAQMQVVGKRHYGRKAVPHGGGGGRQAARELFDTLLLWRGRVLLDAQGEAELDVPLSDSLTAFRLTAVANAGTGLFGTGSSAIRTTQDLMAHSGVPPLIREGDTFQATFTVRNASDRAVTARAEAKLNITPEPVRPPALAPQNLTLNPGEATEIGWSVEVPAAATKLEWELVVEEQGATAARDSLRIAQEVIPAVPVRVHQATLVQLEQPLRMAVEKPANALPERGGVRVALQAKLGDDVSGIRDYMQDYRYSCLEQRASKAVALRDPQLWRAITAQLPNYLDSDGLFKYFPSDALRGSDVLTTYLLAIAHEAGWPLPTDLQNRAVEGLKGFVEGRLARKSRLAAPDLVLRKLAAIEALSRHGAAKPEMLGTLTLEPKLWPTSAVIDWLSILDRVRDIPQRDTRRREALQILQSRFTVRGTTMVLSAETKERLWWLMRSADVDTVRAILTLSDQSAWKDDLPKLVAGALQRQIRGHWDTTVANAWGVLALEKFGGLFQGTPVAGNSDIALGAVRSGWAWTPERQRAELDFLWPAQESWLELEHHGAGAPWAVIQSRAALPLQEADFSGYSIRRSIEPVEQQQTGQWSRGDVARIRLELEAQAEMAWVVVDDPVPAGASILGTGLGRDSALLSAGEQREGAVWPIYEERRFDAFRAYYDYVPKGKWLLEYTVRFNTPGRFGLPPTRVEALYAPDVRGESPNPVLEIRAGP